jgi:hypothetical protein
VARVGGWRHRDRVMRRWLERGVFVVAALASIATSPKRWWLKVDKLPAISDPTRTSRLVVDASERPEVTVSQPKGSTVLPTMHEDGAHYTYLVPAGSSVASIEIRHSCHMGCGADDCVPPPDAFVRVGSLTTVAMWRIEAASKPISTVVGAERPFPWFEIVTDASIDPAITITTADDINPEIHGDGNRRLVLLTPLGKPRVQTAVWTVHAVIEGACPTDAPCQPPAGEHLSIQSVDAKEAGFAP